MNENNKPFSNETIEKLNKPSKFSHIMKYFVAVLGTFVLIVLCYLIYVVISYTRVVDNFVLSINNKVENVLDVNDKDKEYKILSYNIGFCAYTDDFGFFMDGGDQSRAVSKESVESVANAIANLSSSLNPDFVFFQEVDVKSTRSHFVNQRTYLEKAFLGYTNTFAVNYDSPYLFYPFTKPIGKSLSGIETISKYSINSSIRRSLPVERGLYAFLDLDRCYTKNVIATTDKNLVLYNVHLSAYTSDGKIVLEQLEMLINDMLSEANKGNYIVCGGDFNKDLLQDSSKYFGISKDEYTWAQAFPLEILEDTPFSIVSSVEGETLVPSCRNADGPYNDKQLVLTIDGFIVSSNISVKSCSVIDTMFKYSDHNPVEMIFTLK